MAKAHHAPRPPGRTKFKVTEHALQRLRERSETVLHMRDAVARKALDDAVRNALSVERLAEDVVGIDDEPARLVDLSETSDGLTVAGDGVYALLKRDANGSGGEVVVTVLDRACAERVRRESREREVRTPVLEEFVVDNLRRTLEVDLPLSPEVVVDNDDEEPPQAQPAAPEPTEARGEGEYALVDGDGLKQGLTREEAVRLLRSSPGKAKLYRRVHFRVRIEIEEDAR